MLPLKVMDIFSLGICCVIYGSCYVGWVVLVNPNRHKGGGSDLPNHPNRLLDFKQKFTEETYSKTF